VLLKDLLEGRSDFTWNQSLGAGALPAEAAMIQFTSGSTGFPKGIVLGVRQLLASNEISRDHLAGFKDQQIFIPVPQFHAMGNALVFEHLLAGCEVNLANGVMPGEHLLRMISKRIYSIHANPTYFRILLQMESFSPQKLPQLQHFMMGSDWIDASLLGGLRARFPDATVHCRYGLSEAYGALAYQSIGPGDSVIEGSLGKFLPGVEGQLRPTTAQAPNQPAALWITSPTMATEQLMADGTTQSLTDEHGFLNTGDTAVRRDDTHWVLAGRESQFIKVNGHRISPFEIEEALRNIPGVAEASATGVPDPVTGQRIVACIVSKPGATLAVDILRKACAGQLSPYKIPQVFLLEFPIPKTASGKVARAKLAELVADSLRGTK
jgi:acyl-coenzyme A synthetase/AMP-(fatty) acid ligase